MNILYCFSQKNDYVGEVRVALELANEMGKNDNVSVLCPGEEFRKMQRENYMLNQYKSDSVGVEAMAPLSSKYVKWVFDILDNFKPDIVHFHDTHPICFLVEVWAMLNDVPIFFTPHIMPSTMLDFGDNFLEKLSQILIDVPVNKYFEIFYENVDVLIALNGHIKNDVIDYGYPGRVAQIPNGRDLSKYLNLEYYDVSKNPKILTYVGSINRNKNQKFLVKAMKYLGSGYKLKLVGPIFDKKYHEECRKLVKEESIENVEFLGMVKPNEIPEILENTYLFLSASLREVQSLAIIEALASGTPIIGLENETTLDFVSSENGYLFSQDTSPKQFAQKILSMDLSGKEYGKLCVNAREIVKDLDWEYIAERIRFEYSDAIDLLKDVHIVKKRKNNIEDVFNFFKISKFEELSQEISLRRAQKDSNNSNKNEKFKDKLKKLSLKTVLIGVLTAVVSILGAGIWKVFKKRDKQDK